MDPRIHTAEKLKRENEVLRDEIELYVRAEAGMTMVLSDLRRDNEKLHSQLSHLRETHSKSPWSLQAREKYRRDRDEERMPVASTGHPQEGGAKMASEHDNDLPDINDKTLDLVREIGFDTFCCLEHGVVEKVFFIGPDMLAGRERGAHATEEAIKEFILYWENQVAVAKDYLANGRNNKTHEWKKPNITSPDIER